MRSSTPIISIVTIAFNNPTQLELTIKSILEQDFLDYELIVIDGSSDMSTKTLYDMYHNKVSTWITELDDGIYFAMNKGIDLAKGDWITFLNSGDVFFSNNTLSLFSDNLKNPDTVYFGQSLNCFPSGRNYLFPSSKINDINISKCLENNLPNHQAMFFPKKFYISNRYLTNIKIIADKEFKMRCIKKQQSCYIPAIVVKFQVNGISSKVDTIKVFYSIVTDEIKIGLLTNQYLNTIRSIAIHTVKFLLKNLIGTTLFERIVVLNIRN